MTLTRERIQQIHARYDYLIAKYGDDHQTPKLFYIKHRYTLDDYYSDGTWCGSMANENGWTP